MTPERDAGPIVCTPKRLPAHDAIPAALNATHINPTNAPNPALPLEPQHIALLTSKYWGPAARKLTVSFMQKPAYQFRLLVLRHMNAWYQGGTNVHFVYTTGVGDVRITTEPDGYWSYLGTDIHMIPTTEPTMCLEAFTAATPDSEYRRVVRHETGHTLGFVHEHMRRELVAQIDARKAYAYFRYWDGWDKATVDQQVLTPLDDASIMGTPADQTSIMCYQLPGSITINGTPIVGGVDINATDIGYARKIYPKR